jgi:hypothetical protein
MRRTSSAVLGAIALFCLFPEASHAQDRPLSEILTSLYTTQNPLILANNNHAAHFASASTTSFANTAALLNKNISYQLSSFPLGSSSGGFTFTLDESLGTLARTTDSFGPLFAERALTSGRGKLTLGSSYLHSTYDKFEGKELSGGEIHTTLQHVDIPTIDSHFEGDLIDAAFRLDLKTDTFAVFANYGVTDRLDVGVVVPLQRVEMNAQIDLTILNQATSGDAVPSHIFSNGTLHETRTDGGDASGIGDVVLRGKLGLAQGGWGGFAAAVDVRLPTGDAADLLGTGSTQVKGFLIVSGGKSRFSPHLNAGYTFTGDSDEFGVLPDEINYAGGFDAALSSRLTLNADVVGRALLDAERLVDTDTTYFYRTASDPVGTRRTVTRTEITSAGETGTLNLLFAALGLKFNPTGRLLISGNLLISLSKDNGLQDTLTPVFAIDYNF